MIDLFNGNTASKTSKKAYNVTVLKLEFELFMPL